MGNRCANHVTPLYPQKLAVTSPTGGGRSVGMVRSRTKATEFSLVLVFQHTTGMTHLSTLTDLFYYFTSSIVVHFYSLDCINNAILCLSTMEKLFRI